MSDEVMRESVERCKSNRIIKQYIGLRPLPSRRDERSKNIMPITRRGITTSFASRVPPFSPLLLLPPCIFREGRLARLNSRTCGTAFGGRGLEYPRKNELARCCLSRRGFPDELPQELYVSPYIRERAIAVLSPMLLCCSTNAVNKILPVNRESRVNTRYDDFLIVINSYLPQARARMHV